jgi:hypothetical protein
VGFAQIAGDSSEDESEAEESSDYEEASDEDEEEVSLVTPSRSVLVP